MALTNNIVEIIQRPLIQQLTRFGIVGTVSAAVNILLVILFVETTGMHPLVANIFAYFLAFNISYFGHCYWSFSKTEVCHRSSISKFLLIVIIGFGLNELLFYLFLTTFHLYYVVALFLVLLIVPTFTFVTSKFWVFKY